MLRRCCPSAFTGSLLVYLVGPARWNRLPKRAVPLFRECRPRVRPTSPALGSVSAFTSLQELAKKRLSSNASSQKTYIRMPRVLLEDKLSSRRWRTGSYAKFMTSHAMAIYARRTGPQQERQKQPVAISSARVKDEHYFTYWSLPSPALQPRNCRYLHRFRRPNL